MWVSLDLKPKSKLLPYTLQYTCVPDLRPSCFDMEWLSLKIKEMPFSLIFKTIVAVQLWLGFPLIHWENTKNAEVVKSPPCFLQRMTALPLCCAHKFCFYVCFFVQPRCRVIITWGLTKSLLQERNHYIQLAWIKLEQVCLTDMLFLTRCSTSSSLLKL